MWTRADTSRAAATIAAAALIFCHPSLAAGQTRQQIDWCNGKDGAAADLQIGGCTAVIQSGKFTGKNLAVAFYKRGEALGKSGQTDRAIADYDQAIRLYPQYAAAFTNRGQAYMRKKDYQSAVRDFAKSTALDPKRPGPWAYQGDAYYHLGQEERAIASFAEAIKLDPEWMWPANDRGELYLDRGDYELAIRDFDHVVRVSAAYAMGWNNRCRALAIVGRLEQALKDCDEALKINPKFVNHMAKSGEVSAIQHRGFVHLKAGRFALAIEDYDKASELRPKSAEVLYGRGVAKLKSGDTTGGNADVGAAKAIQADIAEKFARFGVK